jgi:predicted membrane-bound spermidine synthase
MEKSRWFYCFFLVSGFCGLVYEVVWLRLAMARFGVTTPMVSIVLSVFMAGLGIGSWAGGLFVRRYERAAAGIPFRLYGAVELLIGLGSIAAPATMELGHQWMRSHTELAWDSGSYYLVSGGWIVLSMLPWCTCMGATFPFAMAAIRRSAPEESSRSFSYLYLANVMGAIIGTLLPAYVLIELLGFQGTLRVARSLNLMLGLGVILLTFGYAGPDYVEPPRPKHGHDHGGSRSILWMLFTTGLCSMAMEVVWIREFTPYLGNMVYAFAALLAVYLGATFLGSWIYRTWSDPKNLSPGVVLWVLLGAASLLPLLAADPFGEERHGFNWGLVRTILGVAPFSAMVGYLTPMLVDRWSGGDPDRAGRAYAINVLGSILGPLVAGFAVLPWVGAHSGLGILALPLFAVGLFAARNRNGRSRRFLKLAPMTLFGVSLAASAPLVLATNSFESVFEDRLELRDYTATVVATGEDMGRRLLVNGSGMTVLTSLTKIMAHLPLSYLDQPPRKGLVICFGMGTSFRSMLSWGIQTTAVELVPSVPKAFGYYHDDGPALLKLPNAHVVIDDGRRYLERSNEQFDVIVVDPPPPIMAPTSSFLYSGEFYAVLKPHLRPGGIAQIWFPGGDDTVQASVAKALKASFPYVRAYRSIEGWGVHFLARMEPFPAIVDGKLPQTLPDGAAKDLSEWLATAPQDILANALRREVSLDKLIEAAPTVPAIDDDRPINEYFYLRSSGVLKY